MDLEKLFGPQLVDGQGNRCATSVLSQCDVIGIYFGDSLQAPCKSFLPHLKRFYEKTRPRLQQDRGLSFEMVFVSFEETSESEFEKHFSQMSWFALPYSDRTLKGKLCKRFKVVTIPTLILIHGSSGEIITADGRHRILDDPEGVGFPWQPKPFHEIIGNAPLLQCSNKKEVSTSQLKGKKLGLFFAAHWCPPCKALTGELINTYQRLRADGKNLEVLYLSSDTSEDNFNNFTSNMPWLTLPYKDQRIAQLAHLFAISGIPLLVILDETRQIITRYGREAIQDDPEGEEFPWYPRTVDELLDTTYHYLNECACLILFTASTDEDIDRGVELLHPIAVNHIEHVTESRNKEAELVFLVAGNEEPVSGLVRRYAHLPPVCPMLALLDVPEKKKFVLPAIDLTSPNEARASIQSTVAGFLHGKLAFEDIPTNFDYSYL